MHDLLICLSRAGRNMKTVVRVLHNRKRRLLPKPVDQRDQETHGREAIARPLEKEHRDPYRREMVRAPIVRLARGMQREAEKDEADDAGQRFLCLRLRCHTPAEGLAASDKRDIRQQAQGELPRRPNRGLRHGGTIRSL